MCNIISMAPLFLLSCCRGAITTINIIVIDISQWVAVSSSLQGVPSLKLGCPTCQCPPHSLCSFSSFTKFSARESCSLATRISTAQTHTNVFINKAGNINKTADNGVNYDQPGSRSPEAFKFNFFLMGLKLEFFPLAIWHNSKKTFPNKHLNSKWWNLLYISQSQRETNRNIFNGQKQL